MVLIEEMEVVGVQSFLEIQYKGIKKSEKCEQLIEKVAKKCFEEEKLKDKHVVLSVILTNPGTIRKLNSAYRNIDKETDVLSFPMFKKEELKNINFGNTEQILGDIVISLKKVSVQAREYNHSFERELSYMVTHGFYHLMGYDHMNEDDKKRMRQKEESILNGVEETL